MISMQFWRTDSDHFHSWGSGKCFSCNVYRLFVYRQCLTNSNYYSITRTHIFRYFVTQIKTLAVMIFLSFYICSIQWIIMWTNLLSFYLLTSISGLRRRLIQNKFSYSSAATMFVRFFFLLLPSTCRQTMIIQNSIHIIMWLLLLWLLQPLISHLCTHSLMPFKGEQKLWRRRRRRKNNSKRHQID